MPDRLEIIDLHAGYGEAAVLHGVSLTVAGGTINVVLGRNGVGKTTLMRALMGLNPVRRGSIRLAERDITQLAPESRARLGLGLVPQGRRLFRSLTVREHLTVGARAPGPGPAGWTLARVLALFPRLAERLDHRGSMLSGGEQAMVAIARALVGNPRAICHGRTVLIIAHRLSAVRDATRIVVVERGQIVEQGSHAELLTRSDGHYRRLHRLQQGMSG